MKHLLLFIYVLLNTAICFASADSVSSKKMLRFLSHFEAGAYGSMNYYHFNWQTDSSKRNAFDLEKLSIEASYKFNDWIRINSEIEFEHGGTGVTMEFDRFEEFGEFEMDIEKGGEVILDQMNLQLDFSHYFAMKVGRFKLPFGLYYKNDEPLDYLSTTVPEVEYKLIPTSWAEDGLLFYGHFNKTDKWQYKISFTNGLDNSAFTSANWIKRGHQTRFEMVNAESWAGTARVEYFITEKSYAGISFYAGASSGNRPKPDLKTEGLITIAEAHLNLLEEAWRMNAFVMYGHLTNSQAISDANRNLSNNLNVKRTPVASDAIGAYVEAGYNCFQFNKKIQASKLKHTLWLYGRYDFYDSMFKTSGTIFNNPRWQRHAFSVGVNYEMLEHIVFKTQYQIRKVGLVQNNLENTFSTGMGFQF